MVVITVKTKMLCHAFMLLYHKSECKVVGGLDYWNQILGHSSTTSTGHLGSSCTHTSAKRASSLVSWAGPLDKPWVWVKTRSAVSIMELLCHSGNGEVLDGDCELLCYKGTELTIDRMELFVRNKYKPSFP